MGEVEEVGVEAYGAHDRFAHEVVVLFSLQVAVNAYKRTYVHTRTERERGKRTDRARMGGGRSGSREEEGGVRWRARGAERVGGRKGGVD